MCGTRIDFNYVIEDAEDIKMCKNFRFISEKYIEKYIEKCLVYSEHRIIFLSEKTFSKIEKTLL